MYDYPTSSYLSLYRLLCIKYCRQAYGSKSTSMLWGILLTWALQEATLCWLLFFKYTYMLINMLLMIIVSVQAYSVYTHIPNTNIRTHTNWRIDAVAKQHAQRACARDDHCLCARQRRLCVRWSNTLWRPVARRRSCVCVCCLCACACVFVWSALSARLRAVCSRWSGFGVRAKIAKMKTRFSRHHQQRARARAIVLPPCTPEPVTITRAL